MEVSGTVLRQVTGAGTHIPRSCGAVPRGVLARPRVRMVMDSGFCDEGHLRYYQGTKKGSDVITTKKKLKLLKGLSNGLTLFPELGFALDSDKRALLNDLQGNLTSDGGEVLLKMKELEKIRAEEKELKRKRKQEKKAKLKASKMKTCESEPSSSSSSESSDSDRECGEVVNMNSFRAGVAELQPPAMQVNVLSPPAFMPQTTPAEDHAMELCSRNDTCVGSVSAGFKIEGTLVTTSTQKRIEVCMGGKCKRSGAAALLQEFERVVGFQGGAVVGCKCMGKCKTAPNVRIQNSVDPSLDEGLNDSVKIPANPLCIGVGLEDVDAIVARFLGENQNDMGVAVAAAAAAAAN
ncbi:diacylglycerol O-acyltransferase 3-1 [Gastrolobium bilobum]|uniref:diacylglycerol O-acyltransferase 3-1 n=1 Tax=Gastrolobium bilobum TaxID=150636 RepID=UPI002AAF6D49|nr:diacylglycerol O-acyltransferase 3-1 [Gastrolobium bilobum]